MKVEQLKVESLTPYARNARKHSPEQVAQIAASIAEFGFTNPILIDAEGGIIAGHGRVLAAQSLGRDTVPCIRLKHLTEAQRRAYVIVDNRLTETGGGWDEDLLSVELASLRDEFGFDVNVTGFDEGELVRLIGELEEEEEQAEQAAPPGVAAQPTIGPVAMDVVSNNHEAQPRAAQLDTFLNNSIRQLVMAFDAETFEQVVGRLETVRTKHEVETNAQALLVLLETWERGQ